MSLNLQEDQTCANFKKTPSVRSSESGARSSLGKSTQRRHHLQDCSCRLGVLRWGAGMGVGSCPSVCNNAMYNCLSATGEEVEGGGSCLVHFSLSP